MRKVHYFVTACCLSVSLLLSSGCGDGEEITTYPVPSVSVGGDGDAPLPVAGGGTTAGSSANVPSSPSRMLVAMVEQGAQTWFFKLLGPIDDVNEHEDEFNEFVKSLQFADGKPQWTTPGDWKAQGQSGLRLETFHVGDHDPELELTVIPLGTMSGGGDTPILENLNRWRGQLRLPPIAKSDLAKNIDRVELPKGVEAVVMDITGEATTNNRAGQPPTGRGPMASGNPGGSSGTSTAAANNANSPITYDTPEGWTPGETNAFRKAAFNIAKDDEKALVTVIPLPASGTLANINRWRGQVKLDPITEDELKEAIEKITVDGIDGQLVEMVGPEQTIIAAIIEREGRAWFFKLQGDVKLAAAEKERFESFVKSVKFK